MTTRTVRIEACVDSVESALAAERGGADRVELCDDLVEGGTTPSAGMIEVCCERLTIPVFVIIRPRGGDFLYSDAELEVMCRDVARAARLGAGGVVIGLLRPDATIDIERTRILMDQARPMAVTFHRAFDVTPDTDEALDALLQLGVDRVLSSGRAATALQGINTLARMVDRTAGRLLVLAGGGIREENVEQIVTQTGVREVHVRATSPLPSGMSYFNPAVSFGGGTAPPDEIRQVTDAARIARVREIMKGIPPHP